MRPDTTGRWWRASRPFACRVTRWGARGGRVRVARAPDPEPAQAEHAVHARGRDRLPARSAGGEGGHDRGAGGAGARAPGRPPAQRLQRGPAPAAAQLCARRRQSVKWACVCNLTHSSCSALLSPQRCEARALPTRDARRATARAADGVARARSWTRRCGTAARPAARARPRRRCCCRWPRRCCGGRWRTRERRRPRCGRSRARRRRAAPASRGSCGGPRSACAAGRASCSVPRPRNTGRAGCSVPVWPRMRRAAPALERVPAARARAAGRRRLFSPTLAAAPKPGWRGCGVMPDVCLACIRTNAIVQTLDLSRHGGFELCSSRVMSVAQFALVCFQRALAHSYFQGSLRFGAVFMPTQGLSERPCVGTACRHARHADMCSPSR